eukprot:1195356-Prorocentrum_minimum.AAC.2
MSYYIPRRCLVVVPPKICHLASAGWRSRAQWQDSLHNLKRAVVAKLQSEGLTYVREIGFEALWEDNWDAYVPESTPLWP